MRYMTPLRFVDLFAGLGGFHLALKRLGHECVFACELEEELRQLYERNFGVQAAGDICKVPTSEIPEHDILCAGFPCQPFSKAGAQAGLDDPKWGGLFYEILRIIKQHKPLYVILENVPNFARHDEGRTWLKAEYLLRDEGYDVRSHEFSPHHFGIPQIRDRIYIVGKRHGLNGFSWPVIEKTKSEDVSIQSVLETHPADARAIPDQVKQCLEAWHEFLDRALARRSCRRWRPCRSSPSAKGLLTTASAATLRNGLSATTPASLRVSSTIVTSLRMWKLSINHLSFELSGLY